MSLLLFHSLIPLFYSPSPISTPFSRPPVSLGNGRDLSKNKFSEDFPTFLTRMKQVQHITPHITASPLLPYPNPHIRRRLSHNNFTGSIPASISSLASLTYLYAPLIHRPAIFPPTPT
ncbi:unnamed protein product [Closterium sp. NIES-64]|nr:unnamed protein product [Closterium sp. NIES-64]